MRAAQIREELHQFINGADEKTLNLLYAIMKGDSGKEILTTEQQADLETRIARHKNGESISYRWAETRNQIEKRG